jgi:hypothetical protein
VARADRDREGEGSQTDEQCGVLIVCARLVAQAQKLSPCILCGVFSDSAVVHSTCTHQLVRGIHVCCVVPLQLFGDSVPSVPLSSTGNVAAAHSSSLAPLAPPPLQGTSLGFGSADDENTLDEPVLATLKRDVLTIGRNLRSVLIPVNWDFQNHQAALHNWDLWGPLVRGAAAAPCSCTCPCAMQSCVSPLQPP